MKLCFVGFVILPLIILTETEIICKDNQTNEEYVATDSNVDQKIAELSITIERKINDLNDKLNNQYNNLTNIEKIRLENISSQLKQHLNAQIANLSSNINKRFENIVSQHQLNREITNLSEQLKRNTEILSLHLNKIEKFVKPYPTNCIQAVYNTNRSGIYEIKSTAFSPEPFEVFCDGKTRNGGWIVVMRRFNGSVDFNRNWNEYKHGFGDLKGEFFIGMDKLHALTSNGHKQEMLTVLENNEKQFIAYYETFAIGSESERYIIKDLGDASKSLGTIVSYNSGAKFSTKDVDNDRDYTQNCANEFQAPWWHNACYMCTVFKKYDEIGCLNKIINRVEMLIRPVN